MMDLSSLNKLLDNSCSTYQTFAKRFASGEVQIRKLITTQGYEGVLPILEGKVANSDTPLLAEGFQMLSLTGGTFGNIKNIGRCPDDKAPYSKEERNDYKVAYNVLVFFSDGTYKLIGFTSCHHYTGVFQIYPDGYLKVLLDLEGAKFACGDVLESEYLVMLENKSKVALLDDFAKLINTHHPRLKFNKAPVGWCSWYWYYFWIKEQDILDNMNVMDEDDALEYVQIDDGYQTHMGDWLSFTDKFPSGFEQVIQAIHDNGKKPALWVAPFIVSENSVIFKYHRDWLCTDKSGYVVPASNLSYEGWRDLKWYVLDFSKQEVRDYIQDVFLYFHNRLGINYFKLDACYWGAIKGLHFNKANFSRIDNYRVGLETILEVVGNNSFILGCNAAMWPSLGLVHGMRVGDDIERRVNRFKLVADECFNRLWMNNKLWINDPDCLCVHDHKEADQCCSKDEYLFHIAFIMLTSGVLMLGDSLIELTDDEKAQIKKVLEVQKWDKEVFYNDDFTHFILKNKNTDEELQIFLNYESSLKEVSLDFKAQDFMTGHTLADKYVIKSNSALIAKVLK